jgi:hypothetical protein
MQHNLTQQQQQQQQTTHGKMQRIPAPTPKSHESASPSTLSPRGDVSGATKASPAAAHGPCAPLFRMTFSSVQVRPDK